MEKGRKQGSSIVWEQSSKTPSYLDSAYKELLRHDHRANALKNRTKVLNHNQEHILKQIENNEDKISRLQSVKMSHSLDVRKLMRDKARKTQKINEMKIQNLKRRQIHHRQMSTVHLEKSDHLQSRKKEVLHLRQEHSRRIEANKQAEIQKKKQARNKIHNDLMESRQTIQNYFKNKHQTIIQSTRQDIKKLNQKRVQSEVGDMQDSGVKVNQMERDLKMLRKVAVQSRDCYLKGQKQNRLKLVLNREGEQTHPLLRRIQNVMSKYTKIN